MKHDLGLGQIITTPQEKDAIHIAVAPVVAAHKTWPGNDVGMVNGKASEDASTLIGIVDPFLKKAVNAGETFWMYLYPNTITSLRHEWTHPSFEKDSVPEGLAAIKTPNVPVKFQPASAIVQMSDAEIWLRNFAQDDADGMDYSDLLEAADAYVKYQDYICDGGRFEGVYAGKEFWDNYEKVTNTVVSEERRGSLFSCSC